MTAPGKYTSGYLDASKASELRIDDALASIDQMNGVALNFIHSLGLPIEQYDIVGGKNVNPTDHSQSMPASTTPTS